MTAHSLIGASSMARIIACEASLLAAIEAVKAGRAPPASIYAATGTVAHALADECLKEGYDPGAQIGQQVVVDGHNIRVDEKMVAAVRLYINTVRNLAASATWHAFETRVCLDSYWRDDERPPMSAFGTADAMIYHAPARHLDLPDYKHGEGVFVNVTNNPQLLYYAAGALLAVPGPVNTIDLIIVQPRVTGEGIEKVRVFHTAAIDVLMWVDDVLKPAIRKALIPNDRYVSGKHCQFCPAAMDCPGLHRSRQDQARADFA